MKLPRRNQIHPLGDLNLEHEESQNERTTFMKKSLNAIFSSPIHETQEEAKEKHSIICSRREEIMASIVMDGKCPVSWWNLLWGLVGSVLGIAAVFVFVLLPTENVFLHPEYWYQYMLQCSTVYLGKLNKILFKIDLSLMISQIYFQVYLL